MIRTIDESHSFWQPLFGRHLQVYVPTTSTGFRIVAVRLRR
jgi:hypothetical protein